MEEKTIHQKIMSMIRVLVEALKTDESTIGVSAMVCLLVESALLNGATKEHWMQDMDNAWEFYKKERCKAVLHEPV